MMASLRGLVRKSLGGACLLLCALEVGTTGCIKSSADDDSASTGGFGNSGSGGSSSYTPPTCDQECQDYLVSYGVNDTIWYIWNQLIAGRPSGAKDESAQCPLGGTVHITGSTGVSDTGVDSADVTFAFASCENADTIYDLTFTGEVTMQGSFDSQAETLAITFSSSSLVASGGLDVYDDPVIADTCPVTFAQNGYGADGTLVGKVCGRSFNSETALGSSGGSSSSGSGGSTSSGGTSGSGGTGGGGNDCQCFCPNGSDCTGASTPNPCGVDADGIPEACGCPVDCP